MKILLIGLIGAISLSVGSTAIADLLGEEDDIYIGFQVTVPLGAKPGRLMSGGNEYSALLITQHDGIRDGFVFTRDTGGHQVLGYIRPSRDYRIDQHRVSDYTIPMVYLNEGGEMRSSFGVAEGAAALVLAIVAVGKLAEEVIEETTDCLDPDKDSEEIAGC